MNNRLYLDYNATAPISSSVLEWISSPHFFANPSSVHSSGKASKRAMNETRDFLYEVFDIDETSHQLFFHSGATEAINTICKGHADCVANSGQKLNFFYFETDHSCVTNLASDLKRWGHEVHKIELDRKGNFDKAELVKKINSVKGKSLLNFTWVNNETGIVHPIEWASEIKSETGCLVHVDAVQAAGKICTWNKLPKDIDAYTFSAHKFGSLKGIGFTFVREELDFYPLLRGGGQQNGLRSGTENIHGIYSIKLALEELIKNTNYEYLKTAKNIFEKDLLALMGNKGEIVGFENPNRNANTVYFILYDTKAHTSSMALDIAGLDVSNGSACSSGAVLPSRVLLGMGYSEDEAKSAIRLSFSPTWKKEEFQMAFEKLKPILERFL